MHGMKSHAYKQQEINYKATSAPKAQISQVKSTVPIKDILIIKENANSTRGGICKSGFSGKLKRCRRPAQLCGTLGELDHTGR